MKLFLRLKEIAEMLDFPESVTLTILQEHNIHPVARHEARKGAYKRWYAPAIQQLAADLHDEAQKTAANSKSKLKKPLVYDEHIISGKSRSELKLLLSESTLQ